MGLTIKEKYERSDTWQERANTINFYHKLKRMTEKKHTLKATADYFGLSLGLVCEDIQLAENMELVKDCISRKTALTMLKEHEIKAIEPVKETNGRTI